MELTEYDPSCPLALPKNRDYDEKEALVFLFQMGYLKLWNTDGTIIAKTPNWGTLKLFCDTAKHYHGFYTIYSSEVRRALITRSVNEFVEMVCTVFTRCNSRTSWDESTSGLLVFMMVCLECKMAWITVLQHVRRAHGDHFNLAIQIETSDSSTAYVFEVRCLELKSTTDNQNETLNMELEEVANEAFEQVQSNGYDRLLLCDLDIVISVGIAFASEKFIIGYQETNDSKAEYINSDLLEYH